MNVLRSVLKTSFILLSYEIFSVQRHFYRDHHYVSLVILRLLVDDELYKKELLLI